ncbi:MAG: hypothetical protein ABH879_02570 [archaeon]
MTIEDISAVISDPQIMLGIWDYVHDGIAPSASFCGQEYPGVHEGQLPIIGYSLDELRASATAISAVHPTFMVWACPEHYENALAALGDPGSFSEFIEGVQERALRGLVQQICGMPPIGQSNGSHEASRAALDEDIKAFGQDALLWAIAKADGPRLHLRYGGEPNLDLGDLPHPKTDKRILAVFPKAYGFSELYAGL